MTQEMPFAKEYTEILSHMQGPYKWGARDCVSLVYQITNELTVGTFTDEHRQEWHGLDFHEAIARGVKTYGSLEGAYAYEIMRTGGFSSLARGSFSLLDANQLCGAVSILLPPVTTTFYEVSEKHPVLSFTDASNIVWTWSETGLVRVTTAGVVYAIYRPIYRNV